VVDRRHTTPDLATIVLLSTRPDVARTPHLGGRRWRRRPVPPPSLRFSVFRYSLFGIELECDFQLPELSDRQVGSGPVWRVETRFTSPPAWSSPPIGSEPIHGAVMARAFRSSDELRLAFDDTGTFDVRASERTILWYPGPEANEPAVRADLLGRVLSLAAHAEGRLALHASAVSVDGHAIAFLGPKHAGKSTTALALVTAGARLLADDAVVVRVDESGTPWAAAGVQRPRLWVDSVRALRLQAGPSEGEKPTLDPLPREQLQPVEVPLRACYVLNPVSAAGAAVVRNELSPVHAALAFVQFSKLGALLGGSEAPLVLDRAATLAGAVPTYMVDVARDLRLLDSVAEQVLHWHRGVTPPNATPPA